MSRFINDLSNKRICVFRASYFIFCAILSFHWPLAQAQSLPTVAQAPTAKSSSGRSGIPLCAVAISDTPVCLLENAVSRTEAERHLQAETTVYWTEADTLHVAARSPHTSPRLCCTFQTAMDHIVGTDIWTASFRLKELDASIVDVLVVPPLSDQKLKILEFRGRKAPPAPVFAKTLKGTIEQVNFQSQTLGVSRNLTIYLPPIEKRKGKLPVVYLSDGASVGGYAYIVDELIQRGVIRPVILVGIWNAGSSTERPKSLKDDLRASEYLLGVNPPLFDKHEAFVLNEVLPLARSNYGASSKPEDVLLFGTSNGAAWVVSMGLRHHAHFGSVAAASYNWKDAYDGAPLPAQRFYLAAGRYETAFFASTATLSERLKADQAEVDFTPYYSGHSSLMWQTFFVDTLKKFAPNT